MGIFATRSRRVHTGDPEAERELPERVRLGFPQHFEAVGEALASGSDPSAACTVAGRRLARDGASLHEALAALQQTVRSVCSREPDFAVVSALSVAWSEETLAHLHQVSCEDPMTGLASTAHLRARLSELYRGELYRGELYRGEVADRGVATGWAVVVLDLAEGGDRLTRSLRLTRAGRAVRTVFNGSETVARAGKGRLLVLAPRDERIGRRVALVRRLLEVSCEGPVRAWMEGLPTTDAGAARLLDELIRR